MNVEQMKLVDEMRAQFIGNNALKESIDLKGWFYAEHIRNGVVIWRDAFPNLVVNVGKNYTLDGVLQTAVTITGPFMGLTQTAPTPAAGDTMASHAGWVEAGGTNAPAYSGNRPTCAWSAASGGSKSLSAALNFTFTAGGTVGGAFIVLNTGAVATKDNTSGTLFSVGAFTTGDRAVLNTDQINVSYTISA